MKNFKQADPEFAERFEHFALEEVVKEPGQQLDETTRHMAILATLLGCQGTETFQWELPRALDAGITPVMVKEIVYQAVDYLGIGRVLPFLHLTNRVLEERGVALPLEGQATTTMENRLEKGAQTQADIFGPQMLEAWKNGHINRWLAANCFGDYYTRTGLTLAQREMITFCFLAALYWLSQNSECDLLYPKGGRGIIRRQSLGSPTEHWAKEKGPQFLQTFWSWRSDLNRRPADYESAALPTEPLQPVIFSAAVKKDCFSIIQYRPMIVKPDLSQLVKNSEKPPPVSWRRFFYFALESINLMRFS